MNTLLEAAIYTELAIVCGFIIDLLVGDPRWLVHPVVIMGKCISFLEKRLRAVFPKTPQGELKAGRVMAWTMLLGTLGVTLLLSYICFREIS